MQAAACSTVKTVEKKARRSFNRRIHVVCHEVPVREAAQAAQNAVPRQFAEKALGDFLDPRWAGDPIFGIIKLCSQN